MLNRQLLGSVGIEISPSYFRGYEEITQLNRSGCCCPMRYSMFESFLELEVKLEKSRYFCFYV